MPRSVVRLALAAIAVSLAGVLPAQAPRPDSLAIRAATATLRSDLRKFVDAQEEYFTDSLRYALSLRELGNRFHASSGVTIVPLYSSPVKSPEGHSAIAIIDKILGLACAVFVNNAPPPLGMGVPGEPVCQSPYLFGPVQSQQPKLDSATAARVTTTLKSSLHSYVRAQEEYFVDHNTYAVTAQATVLKPSAGVTIVLLTSSGTGHTAIAIHRDAPGVVCGVWVGPEPRPPLHDGAPEGEPTCRVR